MNLILLILSLFGAPNPPIILDDIYMEMSMDTYPYGTDMSPMVITRNGITPTITDYSDSTIIGVIGDTEYIWTRYGICNCNDSNYDLIYSDTFYNY